MQSQEYKLALLTDLFGRKELSKLKIFSFVVNKKFLKFLGDNLRDTQIEIFVDQEKNKDCVDIEFSCDNISVNLIPKLHFKTIYYESNLDSLRGAIFGSINMTCKGIFSNDETVVNFSLFDLIKEKDKRYSVRSILQGLNDKINKETDYTLFEDTLSKKPTDFLNAKEYYKKLKKVSNKLSSDDKVYILSPKVSYDLIDELFKDIDNLVVITQDQIKNLHSKEIYIESEDKSYAGFGSSNYTFSGLGVNKKYTKKELNLFLEEEKSTLEDVESFLLNIDEYVNNWYSRFFNVKDKRIREKKYVEIIKINKIFDEMNKINEKMLNDELTSDIGNRLLIEKAKDVYDIIKKPKEDVISKFFLIKNVQETINEKIKSLNI